jgi:hypothetical protein
MSDNDPRTPSVQEHYLNLSDINPDFRGVYSYLIHGCGGFPTKFCLSRFH